MEEAANILVIDDERGIREGCKRALTPAGYNVDVAETGAVGLRKLREGSFDLVLLDLMMPGMSGMEALDRIHEVDPEIVAIIITGYATVEAAVKTIKKGAYDFISKPFTSDDLLLVVNKGLEHRRLRLETRRLQAFEEEAKELSRANVELEKLDAMKSRFMLTVAHELRAPVAAIQGYLGLILDGYAGDDEQEMIKNAYERCGELLEMLHDLLLLAHMKEKATELKRKKTVSVSKTLEEVFTLLKAEAERKGLTFKVEIHQRPEILADEEDLKQVWTNLISNGIRYTPPGGTVVASLDERDGEVVGTVSDTGIGIAADDLPRIFEEFYRTHQAKEMVEHGTGLGLPIVRQIIETYGGSIDVDSTLGQGTTFQFTLPRSAERGEEALEGGRVVGEDGAS
ncbi:MAG: hybrid sensor histidine kinase/response regulator [Anaerolineae bacterium]|nr:hybrid sensor histidine kinase/response regulator [Anaerolineae bacterium]